jgi:ATP-dependent Clp protease ATP-binding subunit ClpA
LTDNSGKQVDFRNVILIMTSNVGAREMSALPIGFAGVRPATPKAALEKTFSPEFRNRLDAMISFRTLDLAVMERVVDKMIGELQQPLNERDVRLQLSPAARRLLAELGYDPVFGARPLSRLLQQKIGDPLAEELLFGKLRRGGRVRIGCRRRQLTFDFGDQDSPTE